MLAHNTIGPNMNNDLVKDSLMGLLAGLQEVVIARILHYFDPASAQVKELIPDLHSLDQVSLFCRKHNLSPSETLLLLLSLVPHIQPDFLDQVITRALPQEGDFPQIGGVRGKQHRGFLPTGETALFLLAGTDLEKRFEVQELLAEDHFFAKKQVLYLDSPEEGEPRMSGRLILAPEYIDLLTLGKVSRPRFSVNFPAQLIETEMTWEDLVLNPQTTNQIHELENWINHGQILMQEWGMKRKLKPGYRALFYGPPGTGKTLTATLLGKYTQKEVYKVDLSMVVSKYIGETEKNLAKLFARAESKGWILFFDEADALFGKRTGTKDAHDRYANQEVSYLLQRVEMYDGLVILASNLKTNIDEAFLRRFQAVIHFAKPKASERLRIWEIAFPKIVRFDQDVDLKAIARQYELTGSNIMNIVQYCCLEALSRNSNQIAQIDLIRGIQKELAKEGKVV